MSQPDPFRVFISAVSSEFQAARLLVASDLRSKGIEVKTQTDFRLEAGSDTTLAKLHDYIRDCSAVVCVIGKRSGSVPPAKAAQPYAEMLPVGFEEGSYTQWELWVARHYGKRVSLYHAIDAYEPDEPDATGEDRPALQAYFVSWLFEELGLDRGNFSNPDELGRLVLRETWPDQIGNATSIVAERPSVEHFTVETAHGEASVAAAGEDFVELDMRSQHGTKVTPASEAEVPTVIELPTPVTPRVKPLKGLIGRDKEKNDVRAAMADAETVGVHSGKGWGKTALMRSIAYADTDEFPDGVVYLKVPEQSIEDVLQDLHDEFYKHDEPVKPSVSTIEQRLRDKTAVVILDELGMDSGSVEDLTNALPQSFFVLASESSSAFFPEAHLLQLAGLSADEALLFLQKRLRREIAEEEKDAAREICKAVGNHPGRLIEAGNAVLGGQSVTEVARTYQDTTAPGAEVAEAVLADLSPMQQKVAEILDVAKVPVSLALLERVLADDLQGVPDGLLDEVRSLIASDRVEAHSPRYSLTGTVAEAARKHWDSTDWMPALLTNLADWSESPGVTNDEINRDRQFILRTLEWGVEAERWPEVVRVARAVDRGIALGGHWGAWQQVLAYGLVAAEQLGPAGESARAWALHQMGSRAIGIGDDAAALANLTEALDIRKWLKETDAIKVTEHNLNLVTPPLPIRPGVLRAAIGGAVLVATLVIPIAGAPSPWTKPLEFKPAELTFSAEEEWKTVELFNGSDHDINGIQISVSPSAGEFALSDEGTGGEAARTDVTHFVALDMPLAAATTIGADAASPCDLDDNMLDLEKNTGCSLVVVYTPSRSAPATGILRAAVGVDGIDAVLQGSGSTESSTTTTTPEVLDTTTATTAPTTTSSEAPTTTSSEAPPTTGDALPESHPIIDIAHEVVVFGSEGPQQVLVTNVGGDAVTIEGLVQPDNFSAAGCVGDSLDAAETCTLIVTFDGGSGLYCEILELVYDGVGERQVFLKGGN